MSKITLQDLPLLADELGMTRELVESFLFSCKLKNLTPKSMQGYGERVAYLMRWAEQLGVSVSTIKNWAKRFRWQERRRIRQEYRTQQLTQQANQSIQEQVARQQKLLDTGIARLARLLAEGKLRAMPADMARLAKLLARLDRVESLRQEQQMSRRNRVFICLPKKDPLPENDGAEAYLTAGDTHDQYGRPIIPKSQLNDYLERLRRSGG